MASAKDGYLRVLELFADDLAKLDPAAQPERDARWRRLVARLDADFTATVQEVVRLTPTIVEVVVRAPMQARKFHPGQFYRLQNYETDAPVVHDTKLLMEGLALTGAWVDREKGLLSMIVLEMGTSSRLCSLLKTGEEILVMGPTGSPTEIPENETVLLAGGGLGNAVLFSIAKALRENKNEVIYFAGYKNGADLFKREEIENATDKVVWVRNDSVAGSGGTKVAISATVSTRVIDPSGTCPNVPITSGWPACPMNTMCRPDATSRSAWRCTLLTKGQVASR